MYACRSLGKGRGSAVSKLVTTLREELTKISARVTRHSDYAKLELADVAATRNLFATILDRIARLPIPPPLVARAHA